MASKGPAEEYIAAKMKRMKEDNQRIGTDPRTEMETVKNESQGFTQCFCLTTDVESYHEMGIGRKLRLLGKYSVVSQYSVALEDPLYYFPCYLDLWIRNITCILAVRSCFIFSVSAAELPFYTSSTTFRVLSMSCVITSFEFISIPVYGVLILMIVIIGYMMTSKEKDFLVRGLKSAITTGICAMVKYIIWNNPCYKLTSVTMLRSTSKPTGWRSTSYSLQQSHLFSLRTVCFWTFVLCLRVSSWPLVSCPTSFSSAGDTQTWLQRRKRKNTQKHRPRSGKKL